MNEETPPPPDTQQNGPSPRKRGLGRGLNALFDDEEEEYAAAAKPAGEDAATGQTKYTIGVDQIAPRADQPRKHFDEETLQELAASIKQFGILQPLLVRLVEGSEESYEIIAGERRWRAAQIAQLHEVPVIVVTMGDEEAFKVAMIENLQRENLNPVDEANGYQTLMENFGYTQEQIADALGKSRSSVANMVRLRKLPDSVLGHLATGIISTAHAKALLSAREPGRIVDAILQKNLSVRETQQLVDAANGLVHNDIPSGKEKSGHPTDGDPRDINIIHLEQSLMRDTGLSVYINTKYTGKTGKVEIAFKTLDQLDEILKYLTVGASGQAAQNRNYDEDTGEVFEETRASVTARLLD